MLQHFCWLKMMFFFSYIFSPSLSTGDVLPHACQIQKVHTTWNKNFNNHNIPNLDNIFTRYEGIHHNINMAQCPLIGRPEHTAAQLTLLGCILAGRGKPVLRSTHQNTQIWSRIKNNPPKDKEGTECELKRYHHRQEKTSLEDRSWTKSVGIPNCFLPCNV